MGPVRVDNGGDRRGRSASRHLGLQKKKSSGSSRRRPRLKKKTIKDADGSSRRRPRLKKEAIKDDSSRRGQRLKEKTIKDEGGRKMTEAEFKRDPYYIQVRETGGFDVVDAPTYMIEGGVILPNLNFDKDPRLLEVIERCSMKAIDFYNRKHRLKGKYKFVRVLKLCSEVVAGYKHYITFEAKAEAGDPVCFQAVVYISIVVEAIEVLSCRLKPES